MSLLAAAVSASADLPQRMIARLVAPARADSTESAVIASGRYGAVVSGAAPAIDTARSPGDGVLVAVAGELWTRSGSTSSAVPSEGAATVLMRAYDAWGEACFEHVDGAFVAAIWDARRDLCLAGHDAGSARQLCAVKLGDDVLIASGTRAFLADRRFRPRLDDVALAEVTTLGHVLGARSFYSGVTLLPPGCHYRAARGALEIVRDWHPVQALAPRLRGADYVEHMAHAARAVAARTLVGEGVLLPLTAGLDSRLIAAAAPPGAHPTCYTFGAPQDADVRGAGRIAAAAGLVHRIIPLDSGYFARRAAETVWLCDGLLNPAANITGHLMRDLSSWRWFVTGVGGELGRRSYKGRMLLADVSLLCASEQEFERRFVELSCRRGLPDSTLVDPDHLRAQAQQGLLDVLRPTRGLAPVDRIDAFVVEQRTPHSGRPGLELASRWVDARAPLLTRQWAEAVLAGAPSERCDDLARLRLIGALSPRIARVPWAETRLPLPLSTSVVSSMRSVARLRAHAARRPSPPDHPHQASALHSLAERAKRAVYRPGERSDEWLRTDARAWVDSFLDDARLAERGIFDAAGVRTLWRRHLDGKDLGRALGIIVGVELWCRINLDGEEAIVE